MEQLSFFNMIRKDGEYNKTKSPSGSIYYTCAKCNRLVKLDIGRQHLKDGDNPTVYQIDVCECGAVIKW